MSIAPDAVSPHFAVRPDWLALRDEPVLEPALPIVDAHHHLWDRPESRYFLFDFLDDVNASGHDIRATVFMECGAMYRKTGPSDLRELGETEFANGAAAMSASGAYGRTSVCDGIVGFCDLRRGDKVAAIIERHVAIAGGRLRGLRYIAAWHEEPTARGSMATPPPGLLAEPDFRRGLGALQQFGLSFETFVYHTQIDEVVSLARAFPDLPIVLNHVGGAIGIGPYAGRRDAVFQHWNAGMRALADHPNVRVKLTGLGMRMFGFGFGFGDQAAPPSSEELAAAWSPYVLTCIEAFGAERCLFGSNFPVDKGTCSYRVLWNAFKRITAGASAAEKTALFSATAQALYGLSERS